MNKLCRFIAAIAVLLVIHTVSMAQETRRSRRGTAPTEAPTPEQAARAAEAQAAHQQREAERAAAAKKAAAKKKKAAAQAAAAPTATP